MSPREEIVDLGSGTLRLDAGADAWTVVEGSVDIFAVERTGQGDGPRHYLWSAEPGDVLPPATSRDGARFSLTAVGVGATRLRRLALTSLADPAWAAAIDRLVGRVAPLLVPDAYVTLQDILGDDEETLVRQGQRAAIRDSTLWVRHLAGTTRVGAREQLELGEGQGWIPLQGVWLCATASDARLQVLDTQRYLDQGGDCSGLRLLVDLVQSCLTEEIGAGEEEVSRRLEARTASDRRIWQGALGRLASVLRPDEGRTLTPSAASPLLAACRIVGDAASIEFRQPPEWEAARTGNLLASICRVSRVRSRRVALRGEWWRNDAGPLLGYLRETNAPVALVPGKGGRYALIDNAEASRDLTPELAAALQPFAVTFYRPLPDDARRLRDLAAFALPLVRADLATILSAALAGGLLALVVPLATAQVFNQVIPNARPGDFVTVLVALVAAAVGMAMFDVTRAFAQSRTEFRVGAALQAALVDRLLSLPVPFFRRYAVGDLSARASTIQTAQALAGSSTIATVLASAFAAVNLLILFYYDWMLAALTLALLAVTAAVNVTLVRAALRNERLQQEAEGRVTAFVHQILAGITRLRVAGAEARAFASWSAMFARQRELAHRAGRFKVSLGVFNESLPAVCLALLYAAGGWMILERGDAFRTGDFLAFAAAFGALFAASVALSNGLVTLVSAAAVLERARPIVETGPEVTDAKGDPGGLRGLVEGVRLSFRYHSDGPLVLDDVSFRAEPGQFVAFVGPSGSGKSTTLRMLLGFESPETGAVFYDGQDVATLDISAIRSQQLGVVLQGSRLLAGDIFTNIVGAGSSLTLEDAWEAAEAAGLAGDIREMPMGMHTLISDGGSTFSGGQRQRLLIARALVRKPRIILFDEATSALDNRTQETVTRTLELSSATRIVIAHRLSTIRKADRVYVMDRGKIEEEGTFEELAGAGGMFSRLIARQKV